MERKSFYILSCGFTFSTLNFKFSSTTVENPLQIHPFLTNKANFKKSQINVSKLSTKDYDIMDTWSSEKNKPNSNPKQSQFKANTKPIQSQYKPKQTQFPGFPFCYTSQNGIPPIILVSVNLMCIISFSVIVTLLIFMENI